MNEYTYEITKDIGDHEPNNLVKRRKAIANKFLEKEGLKNERIENLYQ